MKPIKTLLDRALALVCIILFGALVVLVVWQVATRYLFNAPSSFSEELATYTFVWLVLLGAALVFGENGHMAMDFLKRKLPESGGTIADGLIQLCIIAFAGIVLIRGGAASAALSWTQATGSVGIPLGYLYLALPVSGVIITFYGLYNLWLLIRARRPLDLIEGVVQKEEVV